MVESLNMLNKLKPIGFTALIVVGVLFLIFKVNPANIKSKIVG